MIQSFSYIASRHIHRFTVLAPWQFTAAFAIYSGINIGVDENNGRRAQSLTEWPREHRNQLSEVVGRKPTSNLNLWKYEHIYPQKNIMTLGHMSQKLLWFPPSTLPHTWVKAVRSLEAKAPPWWREQHVCMLGGNSSGSQQASRGLGCPSTAVHPKTGDRTGGEWDSTSFSLLLPPLR